MLRFFEVLQSCLRQSQGIDLIKLINRIDSGCPDSQKVFRRRWQIAHDVLDLQSRRPQHGFDAGAAHHGDQLILRLAETARSAPLSATALVHSASENGPALGCRPCESW